MRKDRDRHRELFERGLTALVDGDADKAARIFRTIRSPLGLTLAALHSKSWERAATKALAFLALWDRLKAGDEERDLKDEAIGLHALSVAVNRMAGEKLRGGAQERRDALLKRARKRLEGVDWDAVYQHTRRLARRVPELFGPMVTPRLGRRLVQEGLATAADVLLEGNYHYAHWTLRYLGRIEAGANLGTAWPICLHCHDAIRESEAQYGPMLRDQIRTIRSSVVARYEGEPKDLEHALLFGVEASHLASILRLGGDPAQDVLARSDALLQDALRLKPAGKMTRAEPAALAACVDCHRARLAELRGDLDEAIRLFERAVAQDAGAWSEQAAEDVAYARRTLKTEVDRRKASDLRRRRDAAKKAGDAAKERAALLELLAIWDDNALFGRLARLEADAKAEGWTDRASEAVRRGSRDPAILAALTEEAVRKTAEEPRKAIALFHLALRGGPLKSEARASFASALLAAGRPSEAGKVYLDLAKADAERYLDAANAYAADGEVRRVVSAVDALLDSPLPLAKIRKGYDLAASLAPPDALRPLAEKILARDATHRGAKALLARLRAKEFRALIELAARARDEGLAAARDNTWPLAAERLAAIPEEFRDAETRTALAKAFEHLGKAKDALVLYASLQPSRDVLEGRARCQARTGRFEDARGTVRTLADLLDADEAAKFDDDPNLLGLLAEARGDLRGAASRYEDESLLGSLADRARQGNDAVAEFEALARLADRYPERVPETRDRLAALDAVVPLRAKGRYRGDLPTLVLCDTNVLLADLLEDPSAPEALNEGRSPAAAQRLRALRESANVRLAVTRTVARELRAVLLYRSAIQEDEEAAEAVRAFLARAEAAAASLDVARVANVVPRAHAEDLERVRAFYEPFGGRLRRITGRKAAREPDRSAAIVQRRTRGRRRAPGMPEAGDLRLLAEAAQLADAPVAGFGGVGLATNDADFREFRAEIEHAFGVHIL